MSFGCQPTTQKNNYPLLIPEISGLSMYEIQLTPPNTLIYVFGFNFTNYSTVIVGNYQCQTLFNGSSLLGFYLPINIPAGNYEVQVFTSNVNSPPGQTNTAFLISNSVTIDVLL